MFWNFNFNTSGIDTLLAKEDVTLQEVLDDENALQECKTQNNKLIEFLVEDENLKQLLHLVVDEPQDDLEESAKYKYKNLACEVLTIDIYTILDKIANNEEYLDIIWEFIEGPPPLNPLIASFFSKIISILILRKGQETSEYLKKRDGVNKLIVHIGTSAIMELFVKMVTVVESQEQRLDMSQWLDQENLIGKSIDLLVSSENEEKHYNVSQLLSELIRIGRDSISQCTEIEDPLLLTFEKKETVQKLLDTMFQDLSGVNADSSILAGIAILSSLMEIKRPVIEGMEELITQIDLERIANGIHATLESLSERMINFYEVLQKPTDMAPMETTYGRLDPPLGKVRLGVVGLICTAVSTNTKIINDAVAQTDILNTMLDLFAIYEWNNFLHTHVQNCIIAILNTETDIPGEDNESETMQPVDPLLNKLFKDSTLIDRCIKLWKVNQVSEANGSHGRKGYMGHLTKIMNEISNSKEQGPNHEHIMSLFNELSDETREEWNEIVTNSLAETNQKNIIAPMSSNLFLDDSDNGDSDEEVYLEGGKISKRLNISQYDGTLQQAFENYQVQPMTNEFIDSFGYDEAKVDESENMRNPFDDVGNIDFSINANEESENEKLFESICEQKIKPFDDSDEDDDDDEDLWEEKQLTFTSAVEPRQSGNTIKSDSDSSSGDDDENKSSSVFDSDDNSKEEEKMEVDNDGDSKGWWTADFSNMDVQGQDSNDTNTNWADGNSSNNPTSPSLSSSGEAFADFTDISKFTESAETRNSSSPVDMETEGLTKAPVSSVYEVKMEEDHTVHTAPDTKPDNDTHPSKLTQITVKSIRSPSPNPQPSPVDNTTEAVEANDQNKEAETSTPTVNQESEQMPITHTVAVGKAADPVKNEYEHIEMSSEETKAAIVETSIQSPPSPPQTQNTNTEDESLVSEPITSSTADTEQSSDSLT